LVILQHKGVNVAPWNLPEARVEIRSGVITVDGDPLICFHFQGFKHFLGPIYESGLRGFRVPLDSTLRHRVYQPYLAEIVAQENDLKRAGITAGRAHSQRYLAEGWRGMWQRAKRVSSLPRLLLSGSYLVA
jgi:hypothetical protein